MLCRLRTRASWQRREPSGSVPSATAARTCAARAATSQPPFYAEPVEERRRLKVRIAEVGNCAGITTEARRTRSRTESLRFTASARTTSRRPSHLAGLCRRALLRLSLDSISISPWGLTSQDLRCFRCDLPCEWVCLMRLGLRVEVGGNHAPKRRFEPK